MTPPSPSVRRVLYAIAWIAIAGSTAIKTGMWTPHVPTALAPGQNAGRVYGIRFAESSRTVLLYLRSHCRYCTDSIPFYRRLATSAAVVSQRVQLVIIAPDAEPVVAAYLRHHQLDGLRTVPGTHADFSRIRGTPTVVVVDHTGVIVHVAVGKQDAAGERAILDSLGL